MNFQKQLSRSNSKIREDRAKRIAEAARDAQLKLVMDLKAQKRKLENELDGMTDLSSDNQTTSMNVISPNWDADQFMSQIQKLKTDIKMIDIKIQIAEETTKEWFDESVSE